MVGGATRLLDVSGVRLIRWIERRRRLDWWLSGLVLVIAAVDAWAGRHHINPDGISYLDLGDTVFAHGIKAGANVTWSPAYTWILGAALKVARPSRPHELIVVMTVNLVILAVLLAVFAWWLSELFALLRERGARPLISVQLLVLLAYAILAWAVLVAVTVTAVTPDMLLAVAGFAATAILLRVARLGGSPGAWLGLGVVLGLGYLTKSGFISPALVACAACAVMTSGGILRRLFALALSFAACLCIASPFIAVLSNKEGRLEVSSNGALNYAWNVDRMTLYLNWTGGNGEFGRPAHPTLIATSPNTFAYGSPIAGTIPIWYDPSYWYEGVHARFVVGGQVHATAAAIRDTLHVILVGPLVLLLIPVGMMWPARRRDQSPDATQAQALGPGSRPRRAGRAISRYAYLAPPLVGIAAYLPLHTQSRFIAAYVAILAITWFMVACGWRRWEGAPIAAIDRLGVATALVAVITFGWAALRPAGPVVAQLAGHEAPGTTDLRVARALRRAGIRSGDGIGFLGDGEAPLRAYFARLDRARIVGNINDAGGAFWRLTPAEQTTRLRLLNARSGARVVVSDEAAARGAPGWFAIAGTSDSYRLLDGS